MFCRSRIETLMAIGRTALLAGDVFSLYYVGEPWYCLPDCTLYSQTAAALVVEFLPRATKGIRNLAVKCSAVHSIPKGTP